MVKRGISLFLFYFIFWLSLFFLQRATFLFYHFGQTADSPFSEILQVFVKGLIHDFSLSGYIMFLPFAMLLLWMISGRHIILTCIRIYFLFWVALTTILCLADLEIYTEWGVKVNVRAILFLEHPGEVLNTVRTAFLLTSLVLIALITYVSHLVLKRIHRRFSGSKEEAPWRSIGLYAYICITPALLVLGIRGGWGPIPLQVSDVYFSQNNFLNLAATNTSWQLLSGINENRKVLGGEYFKFFPSSDARNTFHEIYSFKSDSTTSILKIPRPNVVLIIMEGVSSEVIGAMNGIPGITPYFDKLCSEGILFDSLYSSGNLSDQGMSSIFSGFPAQPYVSVTTQPDKFDILPSLTRNINAAGYRSLFLFGGELTYGNIRAYMMWNSFHKILESKDLSDLPRGKLGIHDEEMFQVLLKETEQMKQPWFASLFTSSTHSPYDHPPIASSYTSDHEESRYVNSVHYFDEQLKKFIEESRTKSWFDNTLFVFISDHSHRTPKGTERYMPEYRRIPLLFWGAPIHDTLRGRVFHRVSSQIDLASTLLNQLGINSSDFKWSKDLFNANTPEFAFFENTDGFGWIRPGEHIVWSPSMENLWREKTKSPEERQKLLKEGKSYMQVLWEEYMGTAPN